MSKIGEKPIEIPSGVEVEINNQKVSIKGKEGELSFEIGKGLSAFVENNLLTLKRKNDNKKTKSLHGFYRSVLDNAIVGVDKPWAKHLEVTGVGFKVKSTGEDLSFDVGFSHPIIFKKVPGVKFEVDDKKITISGLNRQLVGQTAFKIKKIKKLDPYKGKGIKYMGEKLKLKPGKKAKVAETTK